MPDAPGLGIELDMDKIERMEPVSIGVARFGLRSGIGGGDDAQRVVLAAGAGAKFWPYNVVRQKAAFPIANVPAVRRMVDSLAQIGVNRIALCTGAGEPSVRAALRGCVAMCATYASLRRQAGTRRCAGQRVWTKTFSSCTETW